MGDASMTKSVGPLSCASTRYRTMDSNASRLDAQVRGWRTLRTLRPVPIDLARIALIREFPAPDLARAEVLEDLLRRLGLNDESLGEFPAELHQFCGQGLRVWQYPTQFAKYLADLVALGVRSYVEIGVRHGGSFVATVEVLERFRPLDFAVAVDVIPCPAMNEYAVLNPRIEFACLNSRSTEFAVLLTRLRSIDLVFIDSHHDEEHCRREVGAIRPYAEMIALHDICNVGCPGVGKVWQEIRASSEFECREYMDQYEGMGPYMGIGLAVRRDRLIAARQTGTG